MPSSVSPNFVLISNLNGGLNTRTNPLLTEANMDQKMQSTGLKNVDFFAPGAIRKRFGKVQQGNTIVSSAWLNQTTNNYLATVNGLTGAIGQKFTAGFGGTISSVTLNVSTNVNFNGANVFIYSDSSGPNAQITNGVSTGNISTSQMNVTFTFPIPPTIVNGNVYWIVVQAAGANTMTFGSSAGSSGRVEYTASLGLLAWNAIGLSDLYYQIVAISSSVIQGIYDYRYGSTSSQYVMAAAGGNLYYHARNATPLTGNWTSLSSGYGSGQNVLWAFTTFKNLLITADYGTNVEQLWDRIQSYTMSLGYRPDGATVVNSATGGTVTTGTYQVIFVTTLISGGYRASKIYTVTTTSTTDKIAVSGLAINGTGSTDFGFDVAANATTVFMTLIGGSTFFQLAAASISLSRNPLNNNDTTFNITAPPAGTENTLLAAYTQNQNYFTSQVATPVCKYLSVFNNMVAMAGDANNPNRIWFSQLSSPQIWGTTGGILGDYLDLFDPSESAGDVLNALKVWNGYLYAFKRHSIWLITFTGSSNSPFTAKKLVGNLGALSHWAIKETMKGLVFLSERGIAICYGTFAVTVPACRSILNRFDPNDPNSYNLASMVYTTSGINSTKSQIHFGVSSHIATTRDTTLVYDFEDEVFWENDVAANVYSEVTDINFFPFIWTGDYGSNIWQNDTGLDDGGAAINFYFDTPNMQLGIPFHNKVITQIFVSGVIQTATANGPYLYCDIYLDGSSTIDRTLQWNMSDARFEGGMIQPYGSRANQFTMTFRNSDLDVPVQINSIGIGYNDAGSQRN